MVYKVIVDYGDVFCKSFEKEEEVLNHLKELEKLRDSEDYAYMDILVLKEEDKTEYFLNKLKGGKRWK